METLYYYRVVTGTEANPLAGGIIARSADEAISIFRGHVNAGARIILIQELGEVNAGWLPEEAEDE